MNFEFFLLLLFNSKFIKKNNYKMLFMRRNIILTKKLIVSLPSQSSSSSSLFIENIKAKEYSTHNLNRATIRVRTAHKRAEAISQRNFFTSNKIEIRNSLCSKPYSIVKRMASSESSSISSKVNYDFYFSLVEKIL